MGCGCGKRTADAAARATPVSLAACDGQPNYDGPLNTKRIWVVGMGKEGERLFSQRNLVAASSYARANNLALRAVYCSQVCEAAVSDVYAPALSQ